MVKFFTQEYADKLAETLNNNQEFQGKAGRLNTTLLMTDTTNDRSFLLTFDGGKAKATEATPDTDAVFKFAAPYDVWVSNHKGEMELEKGIMTGKVKFKGSMAKILGVRSQLKMVDDVSRTIDVEY